MSMFFILMALIVGAIAFFHYTQGFFSGTLSAILAIFSAVLAISYHETIVEAFLGGTMADSAHAMILLVLFAVIYTALRTAFDQLIPGGLAMPALANKIGGAAMGVVAGIFAAGVCAFAAQSMSFNPSIMGYSRIVTDEGTASIQESLEKNKRISHPMNDFVQSNLPLHEIEDSDHQKMLLPVDDILIDTVKMLSDKGSLASSKPLSRIHPDWLTELFGQRLGIEASGKRVAMNLSAGKQTDVVARSGGDRPDAGIYLIDRPLPQKLGEQTEISKISITNNEPFRATKKGQIAIVIRVYFGSKAMDPKNNMIELSPSSVRLVTQRTSDETGELEWVNYYPVGTLEDGNTVYRQRADDFLFVDPEGSVADLVFVVTAKGFVQDTRLLPETTIPPSPPFFQDFRKSAKVTEGTFLEVKRLAREDFTDQPLLDLRGLTLSKTKATIARKETVKVPPEKQALVDAGKPAAAVPPEALLEKALGTWEGTVGDVTHRLVVAKNRLIWVTKDGTKETPRTSPLGTLKNENGTLVVPVAGINETLTLSVAIDGNSLVVTDKAGTTFNFTRTSKDTTMAVNPAQPPPPPVAVAADRSIQLLALPEESPKFFQAISVPTGTSGEVAVDNGKVTVIDKKIAALSLNDADQSKLKGAGDQVNSFMKPENMVLLQTEAVSGDNSWNFKAKVGQIKGFDAAGKEYPLVGFWALANDKLVARFNPDGGISLDDYQPTAPPKQIWLMFKGPENTAITKVMIGQAPIAIKP